MVIDQAANIAQAARNAGLSKTSDPLGTGSPTNCKLSTLQGIFETLLARLQEEGGDLANETETAARRKALWDDNKPAPARPTKPCLAVSNTRPWQNAALPPKI